MEAHTDKEHVWYLEKKIAQLRQDIRHYERNGSDIMAGQCYYEIEQIENELKQIKNEKVK